MTLQLYNTHYFLKIMWFTHGLPEPQAQWRVGEREVVVQLPQAAESKGWIRMAQWIFQI